MVVAAGLEPLAVPISLRAEGNQVLADGQADLTGKQTGRGPRAESERAKQERLRRGSAAHLGSEGGCSEQNGATDWSAGRARLTGPRACWHM